MRFKALHARSKKAVVTPATDKKRRGAANNVKRGESLGAVYSLLRESVLLEFGGEEAYPTLGKGGGTVN